MRSLLAIDDLDRPAVERLLDLAERFTEVQQREIPKIPALRGKTVVSLFYEDSTRTRLSFEAAAKRLGADTMTFSAGTSSVSKGESLRDTVQSIDAMGIDAMVVRHRSAGAPHRIAQWIDVPIVNAGDGRHEHPTQALLDLFTVTRHRGRALDGLRVAIVGDIRNSRVARSTTKALALMGAHVTLVGPATLLPPSLDGWPCTTATELDPLLGDLDVLYMLRIQRERGGASGFPSLREYTARWGLTVDRGARLAPDAFVMHPGPMNRGVEIAPEMADGAASLIEEQVTNGVAVRMAVLWDLLGEPGEVV